MNIFTTNNLTQKYLNQVSGICDCNHIDNGGALTCKFDKVLTLANSYILCVNDDDIVMGHIAYEDKDDCFTMWQIAVNPSFKRQGISQKLLEQFKSNAIKQNKTKIISACDKTNIASLNMHLKFGFEITRTSVTKHHFELKI